MNHFGGSMSQFIWLMNDFALVMTYFEFSYEHFAILLYKIFYILSTICYLSYIFLLTDFNMNYFGGVMHHFILDMNHFSRFMNHFDQVMSILLFTVKLHESTFLKSHLFTKIYIFCVESAD